MTGETRARLPLFIILNLKPRFCRRNLGFLINKGGIGDKMEKTLTTTSCPICGGTIVGDGYTLPFHCENVDLPEDRECDAPILLCENKRE